MTPFIATFYSYKGGVGRTILAANVAVLLARSGKTLLWDLDIEAPGLHRITDLASAKPNGEGFFEWLLRWQADREFDAPTPRDCLGLADCLLPVDAQRNLYLLPAFGAEAKVARLYQGIEWSHFLAVKPERGLKLFRDLIDFFGSEAGGGFRYILLDSRTGMTDIGGFLAALLPHVTVMVGNYGVQNTAGLKAIWDALQIQVDGRDADRLLPPLRRELVASPILADDTAEARELHAVWVRHFGLAADRVVDIPERDELRRAEKILALREEDSALVAGYRKVAARLQAIDAERRAEEAGAARAVAERPEFFNAGDPRLSRAAQGKRFEERVADLLRMLGYRVEPEQTVDGVRVDLIATQTRGLDETVYFVECKDHAAAVGTEIVTTLKTWLDTAKARALGARGMVVARRFSPQAGEYAKSQGIRTFTPEDLERALLDFTPYLNRVVSEFAASPLAGCYVEQRVQPEKTPKENAPLLPHAAAWANGEGNRLWVLLGDYGTGKTTFTRRFAYDLAQRALGDPEAPLPLLVNLRDFPNKASLADVLHEHWAMRTGERRDPQIFMHLLARGRIVLLLDSFDEMGVAQAHRNVVEQFRGLVYPTGSAGDAARGNRILVTCREQYFRDKREAEDAVTGANDSLEKVARGFDGAIDRLPRFSHDQIRQYLTLRMGERKGEEAWKTIDGIYNLKSLADRPQLLDIIIESLPELVAQGGAVNAGTLYVAYTNKWLDDPKIRPSERQSSSEQLRRILETLAVELWRRDGQRMHHADLFAFIRARPDLRGNLQVENLDVELRTAAFLSRSAEGYYGFSHRSFLEFFYARAIARALIEPADGLAAALDNKRLSFEVSSFVADLLGEGVATAQQRVKGLLGDAGAPVSVRANAYWLAYSLALGKVDLSVGGERSFQTAMLPWLPEGGACLADVDFADADLLYANFAGADLSRARLDRCDLFSADLSSACLVDASLIEAKLHGANAVGADFTSARAERADAQDVDLSQAKLNGSSWIGADLQDARLDQADFTDADLRAAHLARASGKPRLQGAAVDGLTWAETGSGAALRPARPRVAYPWGHMGEVTGVAFSTDGRRCLTGSWDSTARLWDAESGACLHSFVGHQHGVASIAFSPDGRRCLTGSWDKTARLWDVASGVCLRVFDGHQGWVTSVAFSPDGRRCFTGSADKTARLWDAESGACLRSFESHQNTVTSVACSPDGRCCLTGSSDNTARLWDAESGACLRSFAGHQATVTSVAFSPDGRRCLTGSHDTTAHLWDAESGACLRSFAGHQHWVSSVAFSPDGRRCLTGSYDKIARLWDAESGACLRSFDGHQKRVTSVAFSPDGRRCLTGGEGNSARLWDAESGACLRSFEGRQNRVASLVFSPDGRRCLIGSWDNTARLWDAEYGACLRSFEGHQRRVTSVAFSPDGRRCFTGSEDKTARLWDAESGACLRSFEGHQHGVTSVAFSLDGRRCLTGSDDNTARLWDVESGACLRSFEGHQATVFSVAISADGRRCLTGNRDMTIRLWDAESGTCLRSFEGHQRRITSVDFSPDGRRFLTGSYDNTARLWDAESGACLRSFEGHQNWVTSVAFSPDGRRCLTGSWDKTARLWDVESGACLRSFEGHQGRITSVAFSPDGCRCLTGSEDNTVRLWDVETGACLAWYWAEGDDWFCLDAMRLDENGIVAKPGPLLRSGGRGAQRLKLADAAEQPGPWPWIPRLWPVADFPELLVSE